MESALPPTLPGTICSFSENYTSVTTNTEKSSSSFLPISFMSLWTTWGKDSSSATSCELPIVVGCLSHIIIHVLHHRICFWLWVDAVVWMTSMMAISQNLSEVSPLELARKPALKNHSQGRLIINQQPEVLGWAFVRLSLVKNNPLGSLNL